MNEERGRVFVDSMREASRLAEEASRELRICMAVLDTDDPVEREVHRGVAEDSAMLREMASRLEEAIGEKEGEEWNGGVQRCAGAKGRTDSTVPTIPSGSP